MKLIDILVRELPERGGWPETASTATQDSDGEICFSSGGKHEYCITSWKGGKWTGDGFMAEHAIDYEISIISREQYESALAASKEMIINNPDSDGWISWCGGECPVDGDVVVDVKFRAQGQADLDGDVADNFRWEHFSNGADVVAYRLHKSEHQKPEWDGEGLPPVDMEIEYKFTKVNYRTDFSRGKVLAYGMHNVFMEHWSSKNEFIQPLDRIEFRPIRSEADKERDEAVAVMNALWTPNSKMHCEAIYDAIKSGKIVID
ncbi:hypothetical protein O1E46_RS20925 [Enterobacter hormaechei]